MYFAALLYPCILSMLSLVHGIPVHQNSLKNLVKMQADTIILRIKNHNEKLKLSPKLVIGGPELFPEVPADKPLQGLGSIVDTLTTFQKVLQKLPKGHVSQIYNDLSTLVGYLERMKSMLCTLKEPSDDRSLDAFLEDSATHHITFGHLALDRLKEFIQKLIVNPDHLKSC